MDDYDAAVDEIEHIRAALAAAGRDRGARTQVADVIQKCVRGRMPLPELDDLRRRLRSGSALMGVPTVAEWLTRWVSRIKVDPSTERTYQSHLRTHLIPCLGDIVLDKLRPHHVEDLIEWIETRNADILRARKSDDPDVRASMRGVRPTGPATVARIRATLRKAFNDALAREIITGVSNPASLIKTPNPRPRPMVWEPERIARWNATGVVPSTVMVWTPELAGVFLDYAACHAPELYPLLHFLAYRGARRGEACGLLDAEVRLASSEVSIVNQLVNYGGIQRQKPPKSSAGRRDLALDPDTVAVFKLYRAQRAAWQLRAGPAWPDTGLFFVRRNGKAWNPTSVSQAFRRLVAAASLPPIRLHDLRHVAATVALAAGIDIKVVSEQLGHSTTTLTRIRIRAFLNTCTMRQRRPSPRLSAIHGQSAASTSADHQSQRGQVLAPASRPPLPGVETPPVGNASIRPAASLLGLRQTGRHPVAEGLCALRIEWTARYKTTSTALRRHALTRPADKESTAGRAARYVAVPFCAGSYGFVASPGPGFCRPVPGRVGPRQDRRSRMDHVAR